MKRKKNSGNCLRALCSPHKREYNDFDSFDPETIFSFRFVCSAKLSTIRSSHSFSFIPITSHFIDAVIINVTIVEVGVLRDKFLVFPEFV